MNLLIVYPELSYQITGLCFKAHNELGRFCREKQYADKFEELLQKNDIGYRREVNLPDFNSVSIEGNRADFIVDNKIVIDIKAKKFISKDDYYQMQRYLRNTALKLGMIVNFRNVYLKPKRVLNSLV